MVALNSTELKACHAFQANHKLRITCLWMCVDRLHWHERLSVCRARKRHVYAHSNTEVCVCMCHCFVVTNEEQLNWPAW